LLQKLRHLPPKAFAKSLIIHLKFIIMYRKNLILLSFLVILFSSCDESCQQKSNDSSAIIGKQMPELSSDLQSPEVLWAYGRLSDVQLSPDGGKLLYGVSYYSVEQNRGNRELYLMNSDGSDLIQLTHSPKSEFNALWRPDGKKIGFLSSASGSVQLWEINPDGSDLQQISEIEGGIGGFSYSPDQTKILFIKDVIIENPFAALYEGLPKASGRINNDLMYRHWDHWVDAYSHIFVADYGDGHISNETDIMKDEAWGSPLSPFGGMEQISWSPDSKSIAYTCKKKTGLEYTISTNSDIYLYHLDNGTTVNLSEGMMGFDMAPVFSPDGMKIAWESMERDGYESDKTRLIIYNIEKDEITDHSSDFDQNANGLTWKGNSEIFFTSAHLGSYEIFSLDIASGQFRQVSEGIHNYRSIALAGETLITTRQSMSMPTEIYSVDPEDGTATQISFTNKELLDKITMAKVEKRWIKTTDNKDMLTWVIYPPHFDPSKKYPTLLYCQGGPQSMVSQFWSYRWNFQMMAANGYIIVAPNRRGVPGFGQAWNEQISGDYGGQNMKDYFSAIDELSKEEFVDQDRLGAIGASYGGFSVFWLAGNHDKRFKAFIAHDGMFNFESQYLETKVIDKWDTPRLVIHVELDYRIAYTQGMSAFNAAVLRGVPAEFLFFPDENHWVLSPQNGILWQRTFYDWLDKWLK
jgi:dipeptidyl aminopeptidase/acylaminoacyl peptidase